MQENPLLWRRLDYVFTSDFLQNLVETVNILPSILPDHTILKFKFSPINERSRFLSSWKFNNLPTIGKCFVDLMKSNITAFNEESWELKYPVMRWEFPKYKIQQLRLTIPNYSERKVRRIS